MAQIQAIRSTNENAGSYAQGGIIPGGSFVGDNLTANVNSGEMVLNKQQQSNLFKMANDSKKGGANNGNVTIINQTRADVGGDTKTDEQGNMQIVIREAVRQTKDELTNEASQGGGNFLPAMERSYGLTRG